ncbi:MAG: FecR family protein, partial [Abditibacteriales bacterium]|nr:FecR family protein [Abditibacteriales bacterium]MDW8367457.1 FecR domain-containing protein [Abditibacteriales bacterium]
MRRPIFLILFNVMILVVVCAFVVQSLFIMQRVAGVAHISGQAEYQRRGKGAWRPLTMNTLLQTDDVVRTVGPNSTVELYWIDGTRMRLAPNTTMGIKKCTYNGMKRAETSLFHLNLGKVWVRIVRTLSRASKFEVETPTAVATVRGTIFSVTVKPEGSTKVSVYDGTVEVISAAVALAVPHGSYVHVTTPDRVPQIQAFSSAEQQEWKEQIGIITPALQISEPEDNFRTYQDTILVRGSVEPGAILLLNNEPVRVSRLGKFTKVFRLQPGANVLTFIVRDKRGAETHVERTVVRTSTEPIAH